MGAEDDTRRQADQRLTDYLRLAREMSRATTPEELAQRYRAHFQYIVPASRILIINRQQAAAGSVEIMRVGAWQDGADQPPVWQTLELPAALSRGLLWEVAGRGEPLKLDRLCPAPDDPGARYLEGMQSLLAAPVFIDGQVVNVVVLLHRRPGAYTLDNLCTLVLTSNLLGQAVSQTRLRVRLEQAYAALDREFLAVGEIQRQLLPRSLPRIPGLTLATYYQPSTRAGGDYYTFWELPDGRVALLIADVSGHGASAAVVVAMLHALLQTPRHGCPQLSSSPAETLNYLNEQISQTVIGGQFVTAFLGVLRPQDWTMRYANAGHHPPRWLQAGRSAPVSLECQTGLPLAILPGTRYDESEVRFSVGDRLVLYTDGITETFNQRRETFGLEGIDAALDCCSRTPQELVGGIVARVRAFAGGAPPQDDCTIVALAFD